MQDYGYSPVSYGCFGQDSKNYVAYSCVSAWKGAVLCYFETTDASFSFAGGLKAGSSLKQVEKFFGMKFPSKKVFNLQLGGSKAFFILNNRGILIRTCFGDFEVGSGVPSKIFNILKSRIDSMVMSKFYKDKKEK